jgi:hypothetical protein
MYLKNTNANESLNGSMQQSGCEERDRLAVPMKK